MRPPPPRPPHRTSTSRTEYLCVRRESHAAKLATPGRTRAPRAPGVEIERTRSAARRRVRLLALEVEAHPGERVDDRVADEQEARQGDGDCDHAHALGLELRPHHVRG